MNYPPPNKKVCKNCLKIKRKRLNLQYEKMDGYDGPSGSVFKSVFEFNFHSPKEGFPREFHKLRREHSLLCDRRGLVKFTGKALWGDEKN